MKPKITILGTAGALAGEDRDNTYLALSGNESSILIDCGGSPIQKLLKAKIDPQTLESIIITHAHPDHIYGLPILLLDLWLMKRTNPITIYGNSDAIHRANLLIDTFDLRMFKKMFPINFKLIEEVENFEIMSNDEWVIKSTPVEHSVPCCAIRIDTKDGKSLVYSSDTQPCDTLKRLSQNADTLIIECAFPDSEMGVASTSKHTTSGQAGELAEECKVKKLLLIHFGYMDSEHIERYRIEAQSKFSGKVIATKDFEEYYI